jgi:peptide chain release factor 1
MLEKLAGIEERYDELNQLLMEVGDDYQRAAELGKERAELEEFVLKAREYRDVTSRLEEARSLLAESGDEELVQLANAEIADLEPRLERLEQEIKAMLLPKDPRDRKNVILEIRAGTGGDEAALFAADLFRMYSRYAETRGWDVEILDANEIGIGGFKEVIALIKGRGAYSRRPPRAACPGNRGPGAHSHLYGDGSGPG